MPLVFHVLKRDFTGAWHLPRHLTNTQTPFPRITKICRIVLCFPLCLQHLFSNTHTAHQLQLLTSMATHSVLPTIAANSERIWSGFFQSASNRTRLPSPATHTLYIIPAQMHMVQPPPGHTEVNVDCRELEVICILEQHHLHIRIFELNRRELL